MKPETNSAKNIITHNILGPVPSTRPASQFTSLWMTDWHSHFGLHPVRMLSYYRLSVLVIGLFINLFSRFLLQFTLVV